MSGFEGSTGGSARAAAAETTESAGLTPLSDGAHAHAQAHAQAWTVAPVGQRRAVSLPSRIPALPTLPLRALLPFGVAPPPAFPLDRLDAARVPLYYLARNALFRALRALGVGPGAGVLMPAYHHGVEVETVRYTGAEPIFYRVDRRWGADLDDVRARLRRARRPLALYLTHVAGFGQPVAEARALCREHSLLLVEDCALALFSAQPDGTPLGSAAELAVFCLYKSLPVPHGGLALCRAPLCPGEPPPLATTLHHLAGSLLAHDELRSGRRRAGWQLLRRLSRRTVDRVSPPVQVGSLRLRPSSLRLGASALLGPLLRRVDAVAVVERRRRNYQRLLAHLGEERCLRPLDPGTCPLFFPVIVDDKRGVLAALEQLGIEAVDFWSVGDPSCVADSFPDAAWLRRHVLELPIHQDLDEESVDRVARGVKRVLGWA